MIFDWIRARLSLFRPWESAVLAAVAQYLSPEARSLFDAQVRTTNKVQRTARGKDVNLYRIVNGTPCLDESLSFGNRKEMLLAKVVMRGSGAESDLKALVWIVNGHVFSIEFSEHPHTHSAPFQIRSATVFVDPQQPERARKLIADLKSLSGTLARWHSEWGIANVVAPIEEAERQQRASALDLVAPPDYVDLLSASDGFNIAHWRVHGLFEIRTALDARDTMFVLAENDAVGCLVASTQNSGRLKLCLYNGPEFEDAGESFVPAMETMVVRFQETAA